MKWGQDSQQSPSRTCGRMSQEVCVFHCLYVYTETIKHAYGPNPYVPLPLPYPYKPPIPPNPIHYFPVTFSNLKSLTTMYRLSPIHPHRNHLIWLLCAFVIAFCAILTSWGALKKSSGDGWSPICFLLIAILSILDTPSRKLVYFRNIEIVVRV